MDGSLPRRILEDVTRRRTTQGTRGKDHSSERRASIYLFQGKPSNKASGRIRPFFPASCYYLVTWNSARDSLHATISIHLAVSKHTRTALSDKRRTRLSPAYRNRTTPKAEDYTPLVEYQSTGRESSLSVHALGWRTKRALEPYDSIGTGLTSYTWNFKLDGSDLAPIGETGELWLLGPRGDQGYTNEPTETTEPLFDGTNWLLRGCSKISHTEGHTGQVNRLD
ncbi:Uncharacterized protein HZ326_12915 [Fusarium oxysporum f. sp. albedinis]|nr:Uncharacterized protein HZ326_12915 [Fusarium oxysporum f. sp. albedinis]